MRLKEDAEIKATAGLNVYRWKDVCNVADRPWPINLDFEIDKTGVMTVCNLILPMLTIKGEGSPPAEILANQTSA